MEYFKEYFNIIQKEKWNSGFSHIESVDDNDYLKWFYWKIMNNKNREICGISKSGYFFYLRQKKINQIIYEI